VQSAYWFRKVWTLKLEEFLKKKDKLTEELTACDAKELALEIKMSVHVPKDIEAVKQLKSRLSETNTLIALEKGVSSLTGCGYILTAPVYCQSFPPSGPFRQCMPPFFPYNRIPWHAVIVTDMNAIRVSLYKRERMKDQSRYLRYEEAVGSTGQSQVRYGQPDNRNNLIIHRNA